MILWRGGFLGTCICQVIKWECQNLLEFSEVHILDSSGISLIWFSFPDQHSSFDTIIASLFTLYRKQFKCFNPSQTFRLRPLDVSLC